MHDDAHFIAAGTSMPVSALGPCTVVSTTPQLVRSPPGACSRTRAILSDSPGTVPAPKYSPPLPGPAFLCGFSVSPERAQESMAPHAAHWPDPGIHPPRSRSCTEQDGICAGAPQARRGRVILEKLSGKESTAHFPLPSPQSPGQPPPGPEVGVR